MPSILSQTFVNIDKLCSRFFSIVILVGLGLVLRQQYQSLKEGLGFAFEESLAENYIILFQQSIIIITLILLILQLLVIFVSSKRVVFSKILLILLVVSLCAQFAQHQEVKSMKSLLKSGSKFLMDNQSNTERDSCKDNFSKIWPEGALEMYSEAEQKLCTAECPCDEMHSSINKNYSACQWQDQSMTGAEIERKQKLMNKLKALEIELNCSGICQPKSIFFFSDYSVIPINNQENCYDKAVSLIENRVDSQQARYGFTAIFVIFLLALIQLRLISKQSLFQTCILTRIHASSLANEMKDKSSDIINETKEHQLSTRRIVLFDVRFKKQSTFSPIIKSEKVVSNSPIVSEAQETNEPNLLNLHC